MSSKGGNILDREYIWKKTGVDILWEIGGSFVTAVGIYCFADAAHIAPGGVSGLAIMAGYMWEVPIGLAAFVFNIPLLFWHGVIWEKILPSVPFGWPYSARLCWIGSYGPGSRSIRVNGFLGLYSADFCLELAWG